MNEEQTVEKALRLIKNKLTGFLKGGKKKWIISIVLVLILIVITAGAEKIIDFDETEYKEGDWSNAPYSASQYTSSNNITISKEGKIETSMTANELWDKMVKSGSSISTYLNGPKDLLKLMNAELVTQFMDTREDPDEEIDWDKINKNVDSHEVQGIIKMKRANSDGTKTTMTYVDADTFQSYIDEYNKTGSESAKKKAMSHFTLGSTGSKSSNSISSGSAGSDASGTGAEYYSEFASSNPETLKLQEKTTVSNVRTTVYGPGADENSGYENQTSTGINLVDENGIGRHIVAVASNSSIRIADIGDWVYLKSHPEYGYFLVADIGPNKSNWMDIFDIDSDRAASKYGDYNDVCVISKDTVAEYMKNKDSTSTLSSSTNTTDEWYWPTDGTTITSTFGPRSAPVPGASTDHGAIDIGVATGTNVYACDAGTVKQTYTTAVEGDKEANGHAGNWVVIDHGNGYVTKYMHLSSVKVTVGEKVEKGKLIALSGNTGNSSGPHLHFQVEYNGKKVDPLTFKYNNGMGDGSTTPSGSSSSSSGGSISFYAKVATWNETTIKVESNDPQVGNSDSTTYSMTTTNVNYQGMVKSFVMPFDYIWDFLVMGEERKFALDLAELVENSEIEFTVYDNFSNTVDVEVSTRTENVTVKETNPSTGETIEKQESKTYKTTRTTIKKSNRLTIKPTLVDVWMAKYTQEYVYEEPAEEVTEDGENKTIKKIKRYVSAPLQIVEKTDSSTAPNFVTIMNNNSKTKYSLLDSTEWLYEILEKNERTAGLVDLTKYMLHKAMGINTGVDTFDFESLWNQMYASMTNFAAGDIIVNTEMVKSDIVIEEEDKLEEAIQAVTNGQAQTNLLGVLHNGTFMKLQEEYNVNAVFAIAVTIVESGGGVGWSAIPSYTHNWMSMTGSYKGKSVASNGSNPRHWRVYSSFDEATLDFGDQIANGDYYFKAGKFTVKDIAPTYCDEAWGEAVMQYMIKMYEALGIVATTSGGSVQIGEAATIQGTSERIAWLYDGNGVPTSKAENDKYLETFPVEYLSESGSRQTMNVTMHKKLKIEIQAIFKEMADAGFKVIGGDISYRPWGSDTGYSQPFPQSAHVYGHAFDVNPNENYYINLNNGKTVGSFYRPGSNPYSVTEPIINIWKQHGFYWGGDWTSLKDYMHFSYFNH